MICMEEEGVCILHAPANACRSSKACHTVLKLIGIVLVFEVSMTTCRGARGHWGTGGHGGDEELMACPSYAAYVQGSHRGRG